ncbi:MAG: adenylate/guanylate cyclase domain-containing protein [Bradyrhizobium sp.]
MLAADVAGYSRLMGADEVGTLAGLKAARREVVDPAIAGHKGRIVKTTGDGMLVEFASAVDAVTAAMAVQTEMAQRNGNLPSEITFRIGINVGDIIIDGNDIFGDGVNVAARVENECEPGGVCLSGSAFDQVRGKTAFLFDDLGERLLKNIDQPVRLYMARSAAAPAASVRAQPRTTKPLALPDRPSLAVLPFQNMSGDPEQEYFADGVVEDIITALSRFKSLFVIARNSSFAYKGKSPDIRQVGRELGVRYVLEGSVRKAGNRLRITAQLIDAMSGAHAWADRFDGALDDVFELQDEVTQKVVGAIAPRVEQAEIARALRRPSDSTDAYDCYLRGLACINPVTSENVDRALDLFTRAIAFDPGYASAYGMAMSCYTNRVGFSLARDVDKEKSEVARLLQVILRIGQDDGVALGQAAWAVAYVLRDMGAAKQLIDRALELNPNLAAAWTNSGWINLWLGQPGPALEHLARARRLDPTSQTVRLSATAHALFFLDRYSEALAQAEEQLRENPQAHPALRIGAASAAFAGRSDTACHLAGRLQAVDPAFRVSRLRDVLGPYQLNTFVEKYAEGLRRAGLPE